jgi:hypothetical protein
MKAVSMAVCMACAIAAASSAGSRSAQQPSISPSAASADEKQRGGDMTVTGCIQSVDGAGATSGTGGSANSAQYVLVNATTGSATAPVPAGTTGSTAVGAGATETGRNRAAATAGESNTAGASAHGSQVGRRYSLVGRPADLASHVGHRVELTVRPAAAEVRPEPIPHEPQRSVGVPPDGSSSATGGAPEAGQGSQSLARAEQLHVQSVRMISSVCQ